MGSSATAGKREKGDAFVTAAPHGTGGLDVTISSPVRSLFAAAQDEAAARALEEIGAENLTIAVEDNQSLDFVLAARIKAAVLRLRRGEGAL